MKVLLVFCVLFVVGRCKARETKTPVSSQKLTSLANKLWSLDKDRLRYDRDIWVSKQGRVPWMNDGRDYASYPLFKSVDPYFSRKPTFKTFIALLDNYEKRLGISDSLSQREVSETYNFLHQILQTDVMKEAHKYLVREGKAKSSTRDFKRQLFDLWFKEYYRSSIDRVQDSSGFEHVFVGELKPKLHTVSGGHNWVQMLREEKSKRFDYQGYIKTSKNPYLLTFRFTWEGYSKVVTSAFIGTSPEFELALYTVIFLSGYERVRFPLAGSDVIITCFGINRNRRVGTCYPDIA